MIVLNLAKSQRTNCVTTTQTSCEDYSNVNFGILHAKHLGQTVSEGCELLSSVIMLRLINGSMKEDVSFKFKDKIAAKFSIRP